MRAIRNLIYVPIIFWLISADICAAEPEIKFNLLLLPGARAADARLAMPARLNYEHAPLRLCMAQLAERFQFSYWIDRRVDADQPLNVACDGTLRQCLEKLAAGCQAEVGLVENVVTIAHSDHLANMQYTAVRVHDQLMQNLANAETTSRGQANKSRSADAPLKPLEWTMLTTPNQLVELINNHWQTNLPLDLPHDLMNAGQLQACTLATQLSLLYGGFDKCVVGKSISQLRVARLPKAAAWRAGYGQGLVNQQHIESLPDNFPGAKLQKVDRQWELLGSTASHLYLLERAAASSSVTARPDKGKNNPASKDATDPLGSGRYSIAKQANVPLGAVLNNLGQQLGLQITWAPDLPPSAPQTPVTIEANNSKLDEILQGLGAQAKLSIERDATSVKVSAPQ